VVRRFIFFQAATTLNLSLYLKFNRTLDIALIQVCLAIDPVRIVTKAFTVEELNLLQLYKAFVLVSEYV
jgi:hypothetical protein